MASSMPAAGCQPNTYEGESEDEGCNPNNTLYWLGDDATPPWPSQKVTLVFRWSLIGEVLCTVGPIFLPSRFIGHDLPGLLQLERPFQVLVRGCVQPSHDVVLLDSDIADAGNNVIVVEVVLLPYKLLNTRMDPHHLCGKGGTGHRRWYKEFWQFAACGNFVHPKGPISADHEDIHKTYACILQWQALCFREPHVTQRLLPLARYTVVGVVHSIERRTGASYRDVNRFVKDWLQLNSDVLEELENQIRMNPHRNYFS